MILFVQDCLRPDSLVGRRGPDADKILLHTTWSRLSAAVAGYVLHLRGELTPQPLTNDHGDFLLWNGEIFGGIEVYSQIFFCL
jgi:asparagine synthetase B (glutamine-hydrolysing)